MVHQGSVRTRMGRPPVVVVLHHLRRHLGYLILPWMIGCAFIVSTPAEATPQRYYGQPQDLQYTAAGAAVDQAMSYAIRGPEYGRGTAAPAIRLSIIAVLAWTDRKLDRGYRESGAFMAVSGAVFNELRRLLTQGLRGKL